MQWHKLGAKGERFPKWMRELKGKSGVYAIRTNGWIFSTVVYVGESHSGRLDGTLARHFQSWNRGKKFWRGQYAPEQTDPGHTYNRADCEVAFETCSAAKAIELQSAWIARLKPRDNVALVEEAPF